MRCVGRHQYQGFVHRKNIRIRHWDEMNLLILTALVAVCGAAKLDRTYLPPASAKTAGGSPGALQAPNSVSQSSAPKGSYTNDFQGVVVDAALAGSRASGSEETGLGAPRNSYGSTASKVGDAAFRGSQAGFRFPVSSQDFGSANSRFGVTHDSSEHTQFGQAREPEHSLGFGVSGDSQGFEARDSRPERPQAAQERAASTLRFDSEVGAESFNYAFETDNGISAEETGIATNGVQAQGGFSYTGDDGKVYTVTYTADEGGYQPRGDHLPTPPPIPEEILKSLEQNARDEANGIIDDGLYDAQKYNAGSDYAESDSANGKQNGRPSVNTGNTDVDASGTFINQNNLPFNPSNTRQRGDDKTVNQFQATSGSNGGFQNVPTSGNRLGSRNEYLPPFQPSRLQNSRPQIPMANADADSSSTFQQESTEQGSGNFPSHTQQNQHSSMHPSSQSFGPRPSSNNQFNGFKQSISSNGKQFNQNGNRFPSSQGNRQQFGAATATAVHNGHNQFSAQAPGSLNSQHSTSIPDTELTTPFESSPQDAQPSAPTSSNSFGFNTQPSRNGQSQFGSQSSHHQTSQAPAQPTIPSFAQSRPQSSNSRPFGGNRNTQSAFSTQTPQQQEQFSQQSQFSNKRPQFSQNQFSQNVDNQFAPSTQKPQFAQQATGQDDSYYYNQPSRGFNTPQMQGSRFPSAPSNQFDRVTQRPSFSSQTTQYPEEQNYPSTPLPSQNGQRQGTSRYPTPSSFPAESTPSDSRFQSNAVSSATNGITQASASSFAAPTSATGFNRQQLGQSKQQFQQSSFQSNRPSSPEPSKPSFEAQTTVQPQASRGQSQFEKQNFESAQPLNQQPLQDVKQPKLDDATKSDTPVTNQQYNGEIYEYTKPAEMLPPPENGFGQFGQKVQSTQQPAQSRPQFEQMSSASAQQATSGSIAPKPTQFGQNTKAPQDNQFEPRAQFGQASTAQTQQSGSSFGSKPQFGQAGKAQVDQFGAQTASQESADDQFDAKPARQQLSQSTQAHSSNNQFNSQRRPSAQSQSLAGSAETPIPFGQNGRTCCKSQFGQTQSSFGQARRPSQFGGDSFGTSFQSNSALEADQSQSVAGKGELFGGPRAPPSFDETGYHY